MNFIQDGSPNDGNLKHLLNGNIQNECSNEADKLILPEIQIDLKKTFNNIEMSGDIKREPQVFQPCKFHMMKKNCANFSRCRYWHSDFPCKYYYIGLNCPDGNECNFLHGKALSDNIRAQLIQFVLQQPVSMLGEHFDNIKSKFSKTDIETMAELTNALLLQIENPKSTENQNVRDDVNQSKANQENCEMKIDQNTVQSIDKDVEEVMIRSETRLLSESKINKLEKLGFIYKRDLLNITLGQLISIGIRPSEIDIIQNSISTLENSENIAEIKDTDEPFNLNDYLYSGESLYGDGSLEDDQNPFCMDDPSFKNSPKEIGEISDSTDSLNNNLNDMKNVKFNSTLFSTARKEGKPSDEKNGDSQEINASYSSYSPRPYKLVEIVIPPVVKSVRRENIVMRESPKPEANVLGLSRNPPAVESPFIDSEYHGNDENSRTLTTLNSYLMNSKWYIMKSIFEQVPIHSNVTRLANFIDEYHNQPASENKLFSLLGIKNIDEILDVLKNLGLSIDSSGKIFEDPSSNVNQNHMNRSNELSPRNNVNNCQQERNRSQMNGMPTRYNNNKRIQRNNMVGNYNRMPFKRFNNSRRDGQQPRGRYRRQLGRNIHYV